MTRKSWTKEEEQILIEYEEDYPDLTDYEKADLILHEQDITSRTRDSISVRFSNIRTRKRREEKKKIEEELERTKSMDLKRIATVILEEMSVEDRKEVINNFLQ